MGLGSYRRGLGQYRLTFLQISSFRTRSQGLDRHEGGHFAAAVTLKMKWSELVSSCQANLHTWVYRASGRSRLTAPMETPRRLPETPRHHRHPYECDAADWSRNERTGESAASAAAAAWPPCRVSGPG